MNLKRETDSNPPYEDITYTFTVDLHCEDCSRTHNRFIKSIIGTLADIKKVVIGIKGIEIERK